MRVDATRRDPAPRARRALHLAVEAARAVLVASDFSLPLEGVIDGAAERGRHSKPRGGREERDLLAALLQSGLASAKPEAVEKARADHAEKASDAQKYRAALARLG